MAPMHEWKDDAEFLRYNPPEKQNGFVDFLLTLGVITLCFGLFFGAIYMGATEGNADCWRGTARSADCDPFGPCRQVDGHDRIIDVELNYARRHPECRADWSPAKLRYAENYWRTDGADQ